MQPTPLVKVIVLRSPLLLLKEKDVGSNKSNSNSLYETRLVFQSDLHSLTTYFISKSVLKA